MLRSLKRATIAMVAMAILSPIARAETKIRIDGSSTVFPITEAVVEEFSKENKGVNITVGISGTGGGFKKFVRGETDIQDASRPIQQKEIDQCKEAGIEYIEIPIAFDALTIVVHPENPLKEITPAQLKKIWEPAAQGKVTKWSDVDSSWPSEEIKLFGPGTDSGTFDYFTEAINGKAKESRGDYTASEDDNVLVQGVTGNKYALGYFGMAYYIENKDKLKALPVVNKDGKAVAPSVDAVKAGEYNPLARPIFIYVNKASLAKPEVKKLVAFYLENAGDLVKQVGYVPLPDEAYELATKRVDAQQTGSAYGGKDKIGMTLDELFKGELK